MFNKASTFELHRDKTIALSHCPVVEHIGIIDGMNDTVLHSIGRQGHSIGHAGGQGGPQSVQGQVIDGILTSIDVLQSGV